MRVCKKCQEEKELDQFPKAKGYIQGRIWSCKDCRLKYIVRIQRELKEKIVEYLGGECYHCGIIDIPVIYDIHHPDPAQKTSTWAHRKSWKTAKQELDKGLLLLCSNCHRKEHKKIKDEQDLLKKEEGVKNSGRSAKRKAVSQA